MNTIIDWQSCALDIVTTTPLQDSAQIHRRLRRAGHAAPTRSDVNAFLYAQPQLFSRAPGPTPRPLWSPRQASTLRLVPELLAAELTWSPTLALYRWQERALRAWVATGQRGVIEAVTGAGKSRLAIASVEMELRTGGRVVVLVHTRELLRQWQRELVHWLGRCGIYDAVGVLGGGAMDSLTTHRVLVATVQTAANRRLLPPGASGLLIADEVHHYAAQTWQRALQERFRHRLALTATLERDDDGVERVLMPYFGGKCYGLQYREALRDGAIAQFKIALVGVDLTAAEATEYAKASKKLRQYRTKLVRGFGVPAGPHGDFLQAVSRLAQSGAKGARLAGFYLSAMQQRRGLLASASGKLACLQALAPAIRAANRCILFAQTRPAASNAVDTLAVAGVRGAALDAKMGDDERAAVFTDFQQGRLDLIAAPQLFDEGVDIPAADLAIVVAASRSKRQMIQRLGRVLRRKEDGRLARLVVLFAKGTIEDPARGGHEAFLNVVTDVATEVRRFDSGTTSVALVGYLNDWALAPVAAEGSNGRG